MEAQQFDHITRLLSRSTARRRLFGGLMLSPFAGLVVAHPAIDVVAKKKRKKKSRKAKKPQPNAYGCLDVGKACDGDSSLCCSGICEGSKPKKGKPDKSRCVAHHASICRADTDSCTTGVAHHCSSTNIGCGCLLTTGNGGFCGGPGSVCTVCSRDADCEEEFGAGAACVVFGGICELNCPETGGTACVPTCPVADM